MQFHRNIIPKWIISARVKDLMNTRDNTIEKGLFLDKPISATQCFVETNDIVIDPIPE